MPATMGTRSTAKRPVVWRSNPGGQMLFFQAPFFEVLADGNRGGGKTDALLFDFAHGIGRGYGPAWRGILFRLTYPQLSDVIVRSKRWFPRVFPGARYNKADHSWAFPAGEELLLRYMQSEDDYAEYHGHEYPWIGWEQLENWATSLPYENMLTCSRSSMPNMPRKIRATANSYGPGHAWVKNRFVAPAPPCVPHGMPGRKICRISLSLEDNRPFLAADPHYMATLDAISDENRRKAWRYGSWDIVAGAFFSAAWDAEIHVLPPFEVPATWQLLRCHDWGSAKPFCTLWIAESNGETISPGDGDRTFPRGTLIVMAEDYGCALKADGQVAPNVGLGLTARQIATRILALEESKGWGGRVKPGPGDDPLWDAGRHGYSMADEMREAGVPWVRPEKGPGSRVAGWQRLISLLEAAKQQPMEHPGLFVVNQCRHLIRTLPTLMADSRNPDDLDSDGEDHAVDALRLRLLMRDRRGARVPIRGY